MTDELATRLQATLGDGYRLGDEIGGGGMSRVFRARDLSLDRDIVVKVLPPEMAAGVRIGRFRQEIRLAAALQHPLVVPVLDAGEMDGLPWYTMPYVPGESLRGRLQRAGEGGIPVAEAVSLLRDVARALDFAHERGVVHRDVKPDNVLLSHGAAALTDFGVARAVAVAVNSDPGVLTGNGTALGTPAYMAPEQALADPGMDHRVDLYALGVMAYEMLSGRKPFDGRSISEQTVAKLTEAPPPLHRADVPDEFKRLIAACLSAKPQDRPPSARAVAEWLDRIGGGVSGEVAAVSLDRRSSRVAVIAVLALTIVAVTAWALVRDDQSGVGGNAPREALREPLKALASTPAPSAQITRHVVADSTILLVFAADDADVTRGPEVEVDSLAWSIATRVSSHQIMRVQVVDTTPAPADQQRLLADLQARGVRLGVVPWIRVVGDSVVAGAWLADVGPRGGDPRGKTCEMRAPAVPLARRTAALADLASRIHGEISISFDPSVSEVYAVSFPDPITRKRMLRCFTRGEPYESIRDFVRFRRELQRGDRAAAIAALDGIIARGAGGYFERNARSERLLLVPLSAAARLAQWDSLNPPPPADASALRHAQYRRNRADAAGDPRAVLEAAREAFSIQRDVGGLVVPLLASDRPNEILLHLNPEITRLATGDTTPAAQLNAHRRMRFFQHRRSQAHWLLEDDAAMLSDAAAVLTDTAIVPATRRDALPYVLQGLLAMRDTAAWRGVFVRHEPDTPVARAGLLVSSMHFALTHGDTSIARAIAAEIARDYEPMLGQANVPEVLALSVAQAHRRLGRLDRAAELLRALDVSADASTVRAARLQLVRVAAQRGDEATLTSLTKWIEEELAEEDPAAALLGMARLRAVQRNPSEAWRHLEAYAARGFTRWHANIRLDPDLSRLKDYEPAQSFFRPRG